MPFGHAKRRFCSKRRPMLATTDCGPRLCEGARKICAVELNYPSLLWNTQLVEEGEEGSPPELPEGKSRLIWDALAFH